MNVQNLYNDINKYIINKTGLNKEIKCPIKCFMRLVSSNIFWKIQVTTLYIVCSSQAELM